MLSVTIEIIFNAGFVALMVLIWRVSKRPRWRIRSVVYGWAAVFLWAFLWAILLPFSLRGVMDSRSLADTFPDGTIAAAALIGGWFLPLIVVAISNSPRKKTGDDHVA
jgi:TRAP-type C4-dicarboxylate transport system permease small subunit